MQTVSEDPFEDCTASAKGIRVKYVLIHDDEELTRVGVEIKLYIPYVRHVQCTSFLPSLARWALLLDSFALKTKLLVLYFAFVDQY